MQEDQLIATEEKNLQQKIDRLLRPRSIALIGASSSVGSLGASVLTNLEDAGYSGDLYLINPKHPIIHGRACLASIEELPPDIDCAVLAIPGAGVLAAARACAQRSVKGLIVFSAGFAESGEEGRKAQRELASIGQQHDMVLEGPNCLGMVNYVEGIPLTFVATPPQANVEIPGAAIISQSGALAAVIGVNMRHHKVPLTYSISTGNEALNGVEDFVEYLIEDRSTRVLALVVEQFRQPKRFLALVHRAREAGKFVVVLHPGRSMAARASAATHTGAIAGDYDVMHVHITHAGAIHVEDLEELVDVCQILVRCGQPPNTAAAVFTESGAFKAMVFDLCERVGLELPAFSDDAETALRAAMPSFIPVSNPLDLTAQGLVDPTLYRRTLAPVLIEDHFGCVVLAIILTDVKTTALKLPPILDAIRTLKPEKPIVFVSLDEGAPFDSPAIDELRELGVACFPSPERAFRALAYVTRQVRHSRLPHDDAPRVRDLPRGLLAEHKSKQILEGLGVRVPAGRLASSLDEAIKIANTIGFPVVLKAQAAGLAHKSDAGGVALGLDSDNQIIEAWSTMHERVRAHAPGLALEGVLVERMGEKGIELIVGARNDPQWGPVLLVGFGGVLAEVVRDVRLIAPGLSSQEIVDELYQLQCSALLRGSRGAPPADVSAVANVVSIVGLLMQSNPQIVEIDINPLVAHAEGKGALALDALILVGRYDGGPETQN